MRRHREKDVGPYWVEIGEMVQAGWQAAAEKYGIDIHIGGIPPLSHFALQNQEFPSMKAYFIQLLLERGLLVFMSANITAQIILPDCMVATYKNLSVYQPQKIAVDTIFQL